MSVQAFSSLRCHRVSASGAAKRRRLLPSRLKQHTLGGTAARPIIDAVLRSDFLANGAGPAGATRVVDEDRQQPIAAEPSSRSSFSSDSDSNNRGGSSGSGDLAPPSSTNSSPGGVSGKVAASVVLGGGLLLLLAGGVLLKDQIRAFLDLFINIVDDWGPLGYLAYIGLYALLELLAVPAIPLTMTAGIIFGVGAGTAVVSVASTLAATGAFLIARYVARDRVAAWARTNPKFAAIDRAIGKDGFRVVALLRLSPLLPLAASNYLYGLTSVDLGSYVAASWAGMLPGTLAYVAAGTYGKDFLLGVGDGAASGQGGIQPWQIAVGVGVSSVAVWYVGRVATRALAELDEDGALTSGNDER